MLTSTAGRAMLFWRSNSAPAATSTSLPAPPGPRAPLLVAVKTPEVTTIPPVSEALLPERIKVPGPNLTMPRVVLSGAAMVLAVLEPAKTMPVTGVQQPAPKSIDSGSANRIDPLPVSVQPLRIMPPLATDSVAIQRRRGAAAEFDGVGRGAAADRGRPGDADDRRARGSAEIRARIGGRGKGIGGGRAGEREVIAAAVRAAQFPNRPGAEEMLLRESR